MNSAFTVSPTKKDTVTPRSMKVLIVDDASDSLKVLYKTLKDAGYELSLARSGQQGLDITREIKPDLILLDIILPDIDGFEVCRALKADDDVRDIPVIFVSARLETADIIHGFEAGGADYVTKPFVEAEVVARVKNQLAIKSLYDDMERRVAARTEDLSTARDLAEAASRAKSTFLSRMSHEFRTPLNAIIGFGQLQQVTMPDEAPEKFKEMTDHIIEAGQHLLMLVNDILDIEKNEHGESALPLTSCSVEQILEDSLRLVESQAAEKDITIVRDYPDSAYVHANHNRLKQGFVNILSNAIKYNRHGGEVRLRVSEDPDQAVIVSVEDTGPGIAEQDQTAIFEAFHRLPATDSEPGAGLGLALTQFLVRQMHGELHVNSTINRGSTFSISLPAAAAPTESQSHDVT